jgi:hypothetical protein
VEGRRLYLGDCQDGGVTGQVHLWDPAAVGGIYRPPPRRRAGTLRVTEREEIARGIAAGDSYRAVGRRLGRPASTFYREVDRNKWWTKCWAVDADDRSWRRAKRAKTYLLAQRLALGT